MQPLFLDPSAPASRARPGRPHPVAPAESAHGDFLLRRDGAWGELREREPFPGDPLRDLRGAPGLWRALWPDPGRASATRVFDLPPLARRGSGRDAAGPPSAALLDWATATAGGEAHPTEASLLEEAGGWIEPTRRHVRAGSRVAAIELVARPERLALVIPALVWIPAELPAARRAWLAEICHDTQACWRLIRFGLDERAVSAEVDLSGAPADLAPALVELALAALASAAAWALPALAVVADPGVASRTLEERPSLPSRRRKASSRKGRQHRTEKVLEEKEEA